MSKFIISPVATGIKFDLRAANGEAIAASEVYDTRAACLRGIASVRKCAAAGKILDLTEPGGHVTNPKFEVYQDKRCSYRFRLKARNGEVIAASEAYTTKAACLGGVMSVIKNAPEAEIEDLQRE